MAAKQGKVGKFPNTWFLKGGARNTLKVIPTPGSLLKDALQKKLNQEEPLVDGKTKVIELGGDLITKGFGGTQNFGGRGSCFMSHDDNPCLTESETDCRVSRSVYMIECQNCGSLDPPTRSVMLELQVVQHTQEWSNMQKLCRVIKERMLL